MATITTIAAGDQITNSRTDINTNFANLNSDKIETSAIDTDTALAANSDTKVASQKATKAYVDAFTGAVAITSASSTTLSLTTTATQKVIVWAKGQISPGGSGQNAVTVNLKYNGVTKDTVTLDSYGAGTVTYTYNFALMYTETPGAGTHDITVDGGTSVVIIAMKVG